MNLREIIEKNNEEIAIELYGKNITVSPEKRIYAALLKKYTKISKKVSEEFEKEYEKKYSLAKNVEKVRESVLEIFISSINPIVNELKTDLTSVRIYDYTNDNIIIELKDKGYFDDIINVYASLCEEIERIDIDLLGEKAYRESRKDNRGRWEVATFGGSWGDAIGNQLQAGTMNLAGGLAHSVVNAIGNSMSESEARERKSKLYTSSLKKDFVDAVHNACLRAHLFMVNLVDSADFPISSAVITGNDKAKSLKIYENYNSLDVSGDIALDMLQEAVIVDPTFEAIYLELLIKFGDENRSLTKYANLFSVDINPYKEQISVAAYKKLFGQITDEEVLKNVENDVIKLVEGYGVTYNRSKVKELYINKLHELDLQFRTVDGIIFQERSEADEARKEFDEITKVMSSIGQPRYLEDEYEEELKKTLGTISKFKTKIKDKYINEIEKLLKDYDLNYRSVDDVILETRDEANLAREEKKQIESIMPNLANKITKIDNDYEEMLISKKEEVDKYKTAIKNKYLSGLSDKLIEYDKFYRTVSYLENDKLFSTRKEADVARKDLEYIKTVMKDVTAPTKESLFDYKEDIEQRIAMINDNTFTIVKNPYLQLLQSHIESFNKLYLKTGAIFKSKSLEDASRKKFKEKFNFNAMDMSSYEKIDSIWSDIEEYIVKINMSKEQLEIELVPIYTAEKTLNTVDGYVFDSRELAGAARDELHMVNDILNNITFNDSIELKYEEDICNSIEKVKQLKTIIKDKYIELLNEELSKFDKRYKTVDGVTFETREDADIAREEFDSIMELLSGVNPPDKTSMLDYEENVKEKIQILQTNYSTIIANKYIQLLEKYLVDFDVLFRKVSLFGDNSREDAAQKRLKTEMSRLKFLSWQDVDNAKILLDELTQKLGINRSFVPEYDKMIEDNEIRLKTIDGVYFETREAADFARQEYDSIIQLLADVKPPKKTDLLDYEWMVKDKLEKLNSQYNTLIKNKYIELLNKYLVDFDDVFCQISMFKKGTREEAAKAKALKFVKDSKMISVMDVENIRAKLISMLPSIGLQQIDVAEAEQYLEQRKNDIVNGVSTTSGSKFGKLFKR